MNLQELKKWSDGFQKSEKMPALFIGHGHPMNAILDNSFTQKLKVIGESIEKPEAIMVVSAHWETRGTYVSVNANPHTIYDFGRFDNRLFDIKYEPDGHPLLANEVVQLGQEYHIKTDHSMGLDHGAWTVLKFLYPKADIPVFQLSIDYTKPAAYHFELAKQLSALRRKGVLIIGSGNVVHNLRKLDWSNIDAQPYDWNLEFDDLVKKYINEHRFQDLINYQGLGKVAKLAVPTNDHYLPMIYTLGLINSGDVIEHIYEGYQFAGISMRCYKIG